MTSVAQRLRQKLLDLAIHGKLVPQNPKDEPAGELLARIRKARNAGDGRTRTPTAPMPIPEEEIPFDLPRGWVWCRLTDIAEIQLGKMLDAEKNKGKPFRYLANVSVRWGSFDVDNLKTTRFTDGEIEKFALKQGDLLMCEGGVPGRCAVWRECDSEIKYQKALHRIRPYEVLPDYLQMYFEAIYQRPFFTERFTGSTIHHLPREVLMSVPVPLPPLTEQKRIVEKLDAMLKEATRVAEGTERLAQLRKKAKAKILDLAIRGKLVKQEKTDEPAAALLERIAAEKAKLVAEKKIKKEKPLPPIAEEEMPFDLPKGWAWCRFRELGVLTGGHTPSMRNPKFWGGDVLWVTSKDMKRKFIDDTGAKITKLGAEELTMLKPGAVLMCTRSGILRRTFPVAIATKELTINQDQRALSPIVVEMSEYVYTVLCAFEPMILADYRKTGTTVESIIWEKFIDMPVPLPPLAEQHRIVAKVKEMLAACDAFGGEG